MDHCKPTEVLRFSGLFVFQLSPQVSVFLISNSAVCGYFGAFYGRSTSQPPLGLVRNEQALASHSRILYSVLLLVFQERAVILRLAIVALFSIPLPGLASAFPSPQSPFPLFESTAKAPFVVESGDFNGDGVEDTVVLGHLSNQVLVFIGDGSGSFALGQSIQVGDRPFDIAVGDINGNGVLDLAVANQISQDISLFLGDGSGEFHEADSSPFDVGFAPVALDLGDTNGNGFADLFIASFNENLLYVFLGDGTAAFASSQGGPYVVGQGPFSIALGDLNNNNNLDVGIANLLSGTVSFLLGDGAGGFSQAPSGAVAVTSERQVFDTEPLLERVGLGTGRTHGRQQAVGSGPARVRFADISGNGNLDFATANSNSNDVSLFFGDGQGGFSSAPASPFLVGSGPRDLALADLNGSGFLDAVVVNQGDDTLSVLAGDGEGFTALPELLSELGTSPTGVTTVMTITPPATGIVATNFSSDSVSVLLVDEAMEITESLISPIQLASDPVSVVSGDLDGSGRLDVVVVRASVGDAVPLRGLGSAKFTRFSDSSVPLGRGPRASALCDFDADGNLDLVVANFAGDEVSTLPGDGQGGFALTEKMTYATGLGPISVATGDINADGLCDFAVVNIDSGNIAILLNDGAGEFFNALGSPFEVPGSRPRHISLGDITGDGVLDAVVANFLGSTATVLEGQGDGSFQIASSELAVGAGALWSNLSDLNGNGLSDLLVANSGSDSVSLFFAGSDGEFTEAGGSPFPVERDPQAVIAADFDGDGNMDFAVANYRGNSISVYMGSDSGDFVEAPDSPVALQGGGPKALEVADLDGDALPDLIVTGGEPGGGVEHVTVLTSDLFFRDSFESVNQVAN